MGLLTRISTALSTPTRRRRTAPPDGHATRNGFHPPDQASALRAQAGVALEPKGGPRPSSKVVEVSAPRSRQEIFEDLQRNYREAVELIRKVDGHLDRDEARAEQFIAIARRLDDTRPTVESLPEHVSGAAEQIVEAVRTTSLAEEKRAQRLEQILARLGAHVERSSEAHVELTTTMSSFRETLAEIAESNRATSRTLESMERRRSEREEDMARLVTSSRNWMLVALGLCVAMGTVAMTISLVAMLGAE